MIFLYFILICIAIGIINWFIVFPLLEKAKNEKILDILKNIGNVILSIIAVIFVFYSYFAIIVITANLMNKYTKIEQSGIIAFIIVSIFTAITFRQFLQNNEKK